MDFATTICASCARTRAKGIRPGITSFTISAQYGEFRWMIIGRARGTDSGLPHAFHHLKKELHGGLLRPRPALLVDERPHSGLNDLKSHLWQGA